MKRDYRDIAGGGLLLLLGAWVAIYAATAYDLGTIRRMGPGMFPALLGACLAGLGVIIMAPAFFRRGAAMNVSFWVPATVLAGVGAFALLVKPFGLFPAILGVVCVSSLANEGKRPLGIMMVGAGLCLFSWLIFQVGLGVPLAMFRWPF